MTFAMKLKDERRAGWKEGFKEGYAEEFKKGLAEGRLESQIEMIKHMINYGLSVDAIADFLDLSVDEVMKLSEIHDS